MRLKNCCLMHKVVVVIVVLTFILRHGCEVMLIIVPMLTLSLYCICFMNISFCDFEGAVGQYVMHSSLSYILTVEIRVAGRPCDYGSDDPSLQQQGAEGICPCLCRQARAHRGIAEMPQALLLILLWVGTTKSEVSCVFIAIYANCKGIILQK